MKLKKICSIIALFALSSCSLEFTNSSIISSDNDTHISDDTSISSSDTSLSNSSNSTSENKTISPLKKLTILSINDLHGKIEQTNSTQGISNLASLINNVRNENDLDDVCLIGNGDMFQGQAISNLNYGLSVINAMNKMKFDMMGIGNHEFDWGIEKILNYFDGNVLNGEANFPLVNSNVVYRNTNNLLEHTFPYEIVNKEGLKIGFVSAIGADQYTSILKTKADPYEFKDMVTYIGNTAEVLRKDEHCDIVIANIHDGGSYDIRVESNNNKLIASLTGYKRIDALINGHTHQGYNGQIQRDGVALPIVQAYSSCSSLGRIDLEIKDNEVIGCSTSLIDNRYYKGYEKDVEEVVMNDYSLLKDKIEEVYGVSNETINDTSALYTWAGSCMQKATNADIAFSNNGGLRSVNIKKKQNITLSDMYAINPFDNEILYTKISGSTLTNFIKYYGSYNYYSIKEGVEIENSSKMYTVAVIDYLGFKSYFPLSDFYTNTNLIYRDVLTLDIKKRTELGLLFEPTSNPISYLDSLI